MLMSDLTIKYNDQIIIIIIIIIIITVIITTINVTINVIAYVETT